MHMRLRVPLLPLLQSTEIGDDRPLACCAFSPSGQQLASAAWSGLVKLWDMPACAKQLTIKAHDTRITGATRSVGHAEPHTALHHAGKHAQLTNTTSGHATCMR